MTAGPEDRVATVATVDLNSDMGEGFGAFTMGPDAELLEVVTSANVACGFHAGDPRVMDATVAGAARRGVVVGAHVSYPDLVGFGRRHMDVAPEQLATDVLVQIGALHALCRRHGTEVRYVKAHGALYSDLGSDEELSAAFVEAVRSFDQGLAILALPGTAVAAAGAAFGSRVVAEGFPDRSYDAGGRLVPRGRAGAVVTTPEVVASRGVRMALGEPVQAITGAPVAVGAETLCIHSDTPGALELATALRSALLAAGVGVQAFAP
jgi:5-oxoprolinase (ATP-hydrolysing) subunit A